MSSSTDEVRAAAQELTASMAHFLRALDAAGDEDVSGAIGETLADALEELATRVGALTSLG